MIAKMRSSPHITIIILAIDPKGAPILSFPRPPPAPPSPHIMAPPETTVTTRRGPKTGTLWTIASTPPFSILGGNESKSRGGDDAVVSYRSPTMSLRGRLLPPHFSRHRVQRRRLRRRHGDVRVASSQRRPAPHARAPRLPRNFVGSGVRRDWWSPSTSWITWRSRAAFPGTG